MIENIFKPKWMLITHFVVNLVGLALVSSEVIAGVAAAALVNTENPNFILAFNLFWYPEKRQVMIAFVITSAVLFGYCALWARYFIRRKIQAELSTLEYIGFFVSWIFELLLLTQLHRFNFESRKFAVAVSLLWILLFLLPTMARLICKVESTQSGRRAFDRWNQIWNGFTLAFCGGLLFWMFWSPLTKNLRLLNDNLAVPEQTLMKNGPVENIDFIREHKIYGIDFGNPDRIKSNEIQIQWTPELQVWVDENIHRVYYDRQTEILTFLALITAKDRMQLLNILDRSEEIVRLNELWKLNKIPTRVYTAEELEFVNKNALEFHWQIYNRWAIHHHNFVFGPINEYRLGKPLSEINFQYGFLNTLSVYQLTKLLGGFSINNYFRAIYLFYPVYFLVFVLVGWYLTRSRVYLSLITMFTIAGMLYLDFEKILRAPGISPFRHFFDIAAIAAAGWYYRSGKRTGLILSFAACAIQLAFNREFGMFLFAALIAVELLQVFEEGPKKRRVEILIMAVSLGVGAFVILALRGFSSSMNTYYSTGFASFPLGPGVLGFSLLAFSLAYAICAIPGLLDKTRRNTFLFLAVYSNCLFLYYVWGATPPHFQNFISIYALTAVVGLQALMVKLDRPRFDRWFNLGVTISVFILVLLPGLRAYEIARQSFQQIFETHVVHSWTFPRARLETTADPRPFQEAVDAIHKYEPNDNGIYFISTLDNYLAVIADRYSRMPYFDLTWFFLTPKEIEIAKERILTDKPRHLFVDHDILDDYSGAVVNPDLAAIGEGGVNTESVMRINRHNVLKRFFKDVSKEYVRVAEGTLIDVYQRRAPQSR